MGPKETLLTTKAFASRSGLTVNQVTKMLREKKLAGQKLAGKWMIPEGELASGGKTARPAKKKAPSPVRPSSRPPAGKVYSVTEFSAMTYLTEAGVIQWLKKGRLQGIQASGGEWQINAASLELPTLKHLLRP